MDNSLFLLIEAVSVSKSKTDIKTSVNSLLNDFSTNEETANTKYLEKIIEVTGKVTEIKTVKNKGVITLSNEEVFGGVLCHLSQEATKQLRFFKEGETVTIKGICTGYLMDAILIECIIINNEK